MLFRSVFSTSALPAQAARSLVTEPQSTMEQVDYHIHMTGHVSYTSHNTDEKSDDDDDEEEPDSGGGGGGGWWSFLK